MLHHEQNGHKTPWSGLERGGGDHQLAVLRPSSQFVFPGGAERDDFSDISGSNFHGSL